MQKNYLKVNCNISKKDLLVLELLYQREKRTVLAATNKEDIVGLLADEFISVKGGCFRLT